MWTCTSKSSGRTCRLSIGSMERIPLALHFLADTPSCYLCVGVPEKGIESGAPFVNSEVT